MIYLLIASFLWGTSFIAGKIAYSMFDPSLVVALRYIFASIILLPVTISFMHQEKETINKKDFFMLILLGILTYPLTSMLQFIGLSFTSASSATTIIGIEPIMITMIGFIFFKEKMTSFQIGAVIVAFLGVMLVIKPSGSGLISTGALAALVGALFAGMAYTCVRYLGTHNISGEFIIFFFSLTSTLMLLPYLIFDYHVMTFYQLSMLILAGASASIGQYGITFAYRYAAAKNIAAFDYSQVVFSGILGFIVLGEIPDFQSFIGYVIVISVGIVLVLRSK